MKKIVLVCDADHRYFRPQQEIGEPRDHFVEVDDGIGVRLLNHTVDKADGGSHAPQMA